MILYLRVGKIREHHPKATDHASAIGHPASFAVRSALVQGRCAGVLVWSVFHAFSRWNPATDGAVARARRTRFAGRERGVARALAHSSCSWTGTRPVRATLAGVGMPRGDVGPGGK